MLYVAHICGKGRGVLSSKTIERDTIIERCPALIIPQKDINHLKSTVLNNYYFCWGRSQDQAAIALGLGSIYNHSYTPNALYRVCEDEEIIEFIAIKKILANQEITINYNGTPNDQSALWDKDSIHWIT